MRLAVQEYVRGGKAGSETREAGQAGAFLARGIPAEVETCFARFRSDVGKSRLPFGSPWLAIREANECWPRGERARIYTFLAIAFIDSIIAVAVFIHPGRAALIVLPDSRPRRAVHSRRGQVISIDLSRPARIRMICKLIRMPIFQYDDCSNPVAGTRQSF